MVPDAEIIKIVVQIFDRLQIGDFTIKVRDGFVFAEEPVKPNSSLLHKDQPSQDPGRHLCRLRCTSRED